MNFFNIFASIKIGAFMFLGRIISKSKKIETLDFVDITGDVSAIDGSLPTLIIGKSFTESIYGKEMVKILDKKISENVWWTYSKTEKRSAFEDDLKKFNEMLVKSIKSGIEYYTMDIFMSSFKSFRKFVEYVEHGPKKSVYIMDDNVYFYHGTKVIGLSLTETDYYGISRSRIINSIKENPNNIIVPDDFILSKSTEGILGSSNIYVPYFHYNTLF